MVYHTTAARGPYAASETNELYLGYTLLPIDQVFHLWEFADGKCLQQMEAG
jgi:hypothetical protein